MEVKIEYIVHTHLHLNKKRENQSIRIALDSAKSWYCVRLLKSEIKSFRNLYNIDVRNIRHTTDESKRKKKKKNSYKFFAIEIINSGILSDQNLHDAFSYTHTLFHSLSLFIWYRCSCVCIWIWINEMFLFFRSPFFVYMLIFIERLLIQEKKNVRHRAHCTFQWCAIFVELPAHTHHTNIRLHVYTIQSITIMILRRTRLNFICGIYKLIAVV